MGPFYAELHLAGATYRVVRCRYACYQATDARGRVRAKVHHDLLALTLDVPPDDTLLAWATAPNKVLAGQVVFYDVTQPVAHETIAFAAGACVGYSETFASGPATTGPTCATSPMPPRLLNCAAAGRLRHWPLQRLCNALARAKCPRRT